MEEGETCTWYFKKITSRGGRTTELKNYGREVKNTKGILNVVECFYENLYAQKCAKVCKRRSWVRF